MLFALEKNSLHITRQNYFILLIWHILRHGQEKLHKGRKTHLGKRQKTPVGLLEGSTLIKYNKLNKLRYTIGKKIYTQKHKRRKELI